jgi:hypothetical protein
VVHLERGRDAVVTRRDVQYRARRHVREALLQGGGVVVHTIPHCATRRDDVDLKTARRRVDACVQDVAVSIGRVEQHASGSTQLISPLSLEFAV